MNYPQRNRENKISQILKTSLILFILLFSLNYLFPNAFSSFSRSSLSPFWKFKEKFITGSALSSWLVSKNSLIEENKSLREEIEGMKMKLLDRNILFEENQELQEALGRTRYESFIMANVLVRPPVSLYDTLVVDVGREDDIKVGDTVLSFESIPIGEIIEVDRMASLLKLYSSAGSKIQAVFANSKSEVEIVGVGGGNFRSKIPKDVEIAVGEEVITPGQNRIIGTVESINEKETDSFKDVFIKGPINIFKIRKVEIIRR